MTSIHIPDGVQSFGRMVAKGHLYADKTGGVPALWSLGERLVLRRPPGFGKTLLLSMLAHYHDVAQRGSWAARFAGLAAAGAAPAADRAAHLVLRLDLCGRRQASREDELIGFCRHYEDFLGPVPAAADLETTLAAALAAVRRAGLPLCVLLDGGDLRELPDWVRDTLVPAADRLLVVGTHAAPDLPVPDVTTAPEIAGLLGFTAAEVARFVDALGVAPRTPLRATLQRFYGGYRFQPGGIEVWHAAGIIHFLWAVYNRRCYPRSFWREVPELPPTDPDLAADVLTAATVSAAHPGVAAELARGALTRAAAPDRLASPNWSQTRFWAARLAACWLTADTEPVAVRAVERLVAGLADIMVGVLNAMPPAPLAARLLAVLSQTGDYTWDWADDGRTLLLRADPRETEPLVHWRLGIGLDTPAARTAWWRPEVPAAGAVDGLTLQQAIIWEDELGHAQVEYGTECTA